jgi:methyl-accepting chemotaxis protein
MTKISDIKIATKVVSLLLLLAVVSAGLLAFSVYKLVTTDADYSVLVKQKSPALVLGVRANRRVSDMAYAGYRTISNPGASREAQEAQKAVTEHGESALQLLTEASRLNPTKAQEYDAMKRDIAALKGKIEQAAALGVADDNERAGLLMKEADRHLAVLSKTIAAFNDAGVEENKQASSRTSAAVHGAILTVGALAAFGILGALGLAVWMMRSTVAVPLQRLSALMARLASGDLSVEVVGADRKDEVGDMARSVQVFRENGLKARELEAEAGREREAAEGERRRNEEAKAVSARELEAVMSSVANGLERLAGGELTYRLDRAFPDAYEPLRRDFNGAMEKLEDTLRAVVASTQAIGSGTSQISEAAEDLSRRTEQQAASLEETAAALDQITATVRRTAEGADHARGLVNQAKTSAERSGEVVGTAVAAMGEIDSSARQISQIIGVIDEIAFQTNLLALNAGVEAARAGDAGKGFAVVASEVRALAQRSAEAAKDIKTLISSSAEQVGRGVDLVAQTGEALQQIVRQVSEITGIVGEIASSAQEQATGLQQVNTAVNQMDQVTQQNAAMVEESTAASQSLAGEAAQLSTMMSQFTITGAQAGSVHKIPKRAARPAPRPQAHAPAHAYAVEGATARKLDVRSHPAPAAETDSWEEF